MSTIPGTVVGYVCMHMHAPQHPSAYIPSFARFCKMALGHAILDNIN